MVVYPQKLDSIQQLSTIDIFQSKKSLENTGFNVYHPDSTLIHNCILSSSNEWLMKSNVAYVKSYGPGNITSLSIRGGTAQQSLVLWNGININNAMLGQSDVSLLTNLPDQEIELIRGGSGAIFGSGAMAGVLAVSQIIKYNQGLKTNAAFVKGTLNDNQFYIKTSYSTKKIATDISFFQNESFNTFYYTNDVNSNKIKNINAYSKQNAGTFNVQFKLNEKSEIIINAWIQRATRFLPDYIVINRKENLQQDKTLRISAQIIRKIKNTELKFQQAILNDEISFFHRLLKLEAISSVQTLVSQIDLPLKIKNYHFLHININDYYSRAFAPNLYTNAIQNRLAINFNYQYKTNNKLLKPIFNLRQEFVSGGEMPLSGGIGLESEIKSFLDLFLNASRLYRVPTLNDLYWNPGGNEKLLSEKGYGGEFGINLKPKIKLFNIQFKNSIYYRDIQNWISWQPGASGIWQAKNFGRVITQGFESEFKMSYKLKKLKLDGFIFYQYNLTMNAFRKSAMDESYEKQVLYSPLYSGSARYNIEYKMLQLAYGHTYTGYRYTSSDNYQFINPFEFAYCEISYSYNVYKKMMLRIFGVVNNLLNENYQMVKNYPQPGRNYKIGIQLKFN
jgi:iron complex outermembrane receptor protein